MATWKVSFQKQATCIHSSAWCEGTMQTAFGCRWLLWKTSWQPAIRLTCANNDQDLDVHEAILIAGTVTESRTLAECPQQAWQVSTRHVWPSIANPRYPPSFVRRMVLLRKQSPKLSQMQPVHSIMWLSLVQCCSQPLA